jgi:hypothetical protein
MVRLRTMLVVSAAAVAMWGGAADRFGGSQAADTRSLSFRSRRSSYRQATAP